MEKIAQQLQRTLDRADCLDLFQSEFRPGNGMEATLVVLLDLWHGENEDYAPILAFLDLLVAFDTIDQGILLDQL